MRVAVIDYGMGNIGSVGNALQFLGSDFFLTREPEEIKSCSHVILPGVGAFGDGMRNLKEYGLIDILRREVLEKKKPFLGICLGMQVLADEGEEGGLYEGLGWIPGRVRKLKIDENKLRLPHIGWNDVCPKPSAKLFQNVSPAVFYFVHSFVFEEKNREAAAAKCEYGEKFTAAIESENIFGTQFHPEKSQQGGLAVLKNFLELR